MLTRILGTVAAFALFGALTVLSAAQRDAERTDATCQLELDVQDHLEIDKRR